MGRKLGTLAIAFGAIVAAVALWAIVDGSVATGETEFVAALVAAVVGVVAVGWGIANYLGAGARI